MPQCSGPPVGVSPQASPAKTVLLTTYADVMMAVWGCVANKHIATLEPTKRAGADCVLRMEIYGLSVVHSATLL